MIVGPVPTPFGTAVATAAGETIKFAEACPPWLEPLDILLGVEGFPGFPFTWGGRGGGCDAKLCVCGGWTAVEGSSILISRSEGRAACRRDIAEGRMADEEEEDGYRREVRIIR